jgi:hypothetical protein
LSFEQFLGGFENSVAHRFLLDLDHRAFTSIPNEICY